MGKSVARTVNKTKLARQLGISRASLYYTKIRDLTDEEVRGQVESVMFDHPDYGHKRIAIDLCMGHNRIRRIMKKFNLKPYRRPANKWLKKKDLGKPPSGYPNLIKSLIEQGLINRSNYVWITDFTYIKYQGKFVYLATIMDLFTRQVVGINISRYHNKHLVIGALQDAVSNNGIAQIIHSDQGSEYNSQEFIQLVEGLHIQVSMSKKGSPWENGYQESFFGHFKQEAGDLTRFETIGELIEYIYQQIYYYNNHRIHSNLKMTPAEYSKRQTV